ncbi:MAG: hypothetical protein HYY84_02680, partial [Deltaproteobacteria bacterium]|nr:hypothetical protein [Deltaproteobacteria bacterium]
MASQRGLRFSREIDAFALKPKKGAAAAEKDVSDSFHVEPATTLADFGGDQPGNGARPAPSAYRDSESADLDPVRIYLSKIGRIQLLDQAGEVRLAREMETGRMRVLDAVFRFPRALDETVRLADEMKSGELRARDVIEGCEVGDLAEEEKERERFLARHGEFVKAVRALSRAAGQKSKAARQKEAVVRAMLLAAFVEMGLS